MTRISICQNENLMQIGSEMMIFQGRAQARLLRVKSVCACKALRLALSV